MAMAASASTSATGPSLHDPLRPTPPPNVSVSNTNAVPWDEQVVPALRKRLEAESAQLAERIKGSSQHRASIQRGPPDGAAGLQYPSSPASNSSGSVVFGAGAGAGSGVVRRGSKVDMDTARQRARAIRERRDSSAPVGRRGQDGGAYAGSQAQNDYYSYGAGGSGSATVGRRGSKAGPSARDGRGMLPPSSSSSASSSAFFPSASAAQQQQQELSSSPYRGTGICPPSGSSSSSRVRAQSTPMQYMGPSSSRASSSSSSAAPARYAAAAPPVPQSAIPQSRQGEAARQRNGQLYNGGGGQRSREAGQMGDFEMVAASHESRRYEPAASPNGAQSGASKYGEAMAPRWPSSHAHLAARSAAPGTAAKLRSATVGGAAHFDAAAAPSSRLPPSSSDPQLLDSFSPLSTNNAYTPTSRSTRAVTEPPPDLPGPSPWDWDEVLPPTIARRVAQEELLKRDPSLQGVEQLIDTWDRSGLPMTQKGIRDLVERQARQKEEEEEEEEEGRGESTVADAGGTTTTATPAVAPVQAEDPSSSSSYSYSSMPSSNNANRQVRLSSLVDGLGLGGSSSRDGGGQGSLPEEGEGTRGGSTADTKASRRQQQQHQNALQEEDGERYQHYQQQQQQQQYAAHHDGQQGHGQTSASTAASSGKAQPQQQQNNKDDSHGAGCCASCVVM